MRPVTPTRHKTRRVIIQENGKPHAKRIVEYVEARDSGGEGGRVCTRLSRALWHMLFVRPEDPIRTKKIPRKFLEIYIRISRTRQKADYPQNSVYVCTYQTHVRT